MSASQHSAPAAAPRYAVDGRDGVDADWRVLELFNDRGNAEFWAVSMSGYEPGNRRVRMLEAQEVRSGHAHPHAPNVLYFGKDYLAGVHGVPIDDMGEVGSIRVKRNVLVDVVELPINTRDGFTRAFITQKAARDLGRRLLDAAADIEAYPARDVA